MFQSHADEQENEITETTIGSLVKITGNLVSEGGVRIDGSLEKGEVKVKGHLEIGPTAVIKANIHADSLTVLGVLEGNAKIISDVEIGDSGRVQGDINAGGHFVIKPGGVFMGKSVMEDRNKVTEGREEEAEKETDSDDDQ